MTEAIDVLEPGYRPLFVALLQWAESDPAIRGLFLTGSIAEGTADRFSDLDLLAIAPTPGLAAAEQAISSVEAPLIVHRLPPGDDAFILSVVTNAWHRVDIAFAPAPGAGAIPVYNPDGLIAPPPATAHFAPTPDDVLAIVTEFFRLYGLSVVVLGRGDVHAAHDGANLMRTLLINLLLAEIPAARPGPKKLRPALSDEQQRVLRSLPALQDNTQALLNFNRAIDATFVPRARTLLTSLGGTWPTEVENATREYLDRSPLYA